MRRDIAFEADGATLRGWLLTPDGGSAPHPAVVMTHGFALVKEQTIGEVARDFAAAGFACLVYDSRNTGASGGEPRQDVDPIANTRDFRTAISFAAAQPEIDPERIGVWGTSYSGAYALAVAALDPRVKCVVAQVMGLSGFEQARRLMTPDQLEELRRSLAQENARALAGTAPAVITMVSREADAAVAFPGERAAGYYLDSAERAPNFRNEITLRSLDRWLEHDVTPYIPRIAPTPLLMIVADQDQISPPDLQLAAFASAREPKKLVLIKGDHFSAYLENRERCNDAAIAWFEAHIGETTASGKTHA